MSEVFAKGIVWNLSDLYTSPEDPRIDADLKLAEGHAIRFASQYKPIFATPEKISADILANLIHDYETIVTLIRKPSCYAHLHFAQKTDAPGAGALMQKTQVRATDIHTQILFWEVAWSKLDQKIVNSIAQSSLLQNKMHYLIQIRKYGPHTLSENEEKIMAIKDNTAGSAFSRLFDETINNIPFYIELGGSRIKKTEGEILSYLHSPDRNERKKASESLAEGLAENSHLLTYIYNMILADHRSSLKIRQYRHPMDPRNLSNETSLSAVLNLMKSVKNAYSIANRYYKLKRKLLGLNDFFDYDRYAPIDSDHEKIPFSECKKIVLDGYYAFSEEAGKIVEQFFVNHWIDAEIREGKQGGGFCSETTPDLHPYILVNYTGSLRDVMTVAHECGHGLHQYLSRKAGVLESSAPLTMAETASVFGEMIIFEGILGQEIKPKRKLALICGKIDDNFATVFRQITMTDFELTAHEAGLKEGELSSERLSDFWMEANQKFYGDSVILTNHYRHGWKYIPHFIHTPFYCYAYAYAQLFVLCLYQKYKQGKTAFIPNYLKMLSLGGSRTPEELASLMGINISDPNFWNLGIEILNQLVEQAETLAVKR